MNTPIHALRWWQCLKSLRNLLLPLPLILPKDLRRNREFMSLIQQARTEDNLIISQDCLMMIWVCGTVRAVVAVNGFA